MPTMLRRLSVWGLGCALLIFTSPWTMIAGAFAVAVVSWILFRVFGTRARATTG